MLLVMLRISLFALIALLYVSAPTSAAERFGDIVVDALVAQVSDAEDGAKIYMTIENRGEAAERLLGAETEIAGLVELRSAIEEGGQQIETPLPAIEIPASSLIALTPGTLYLHLGALTKPLAEGDSFPLTLIFKEAGEAELEVSVEPPGGLEESSTSATQGTTGGTTQGTTGAATQGTTGPVPLDESEGISSEEGSGSLLPAIAPDADTPATLPNDGKL